MKYVILTAAMLASSSLWAAGGTAVEKLANNCFNCHGDKGAAPTMPNAPILAGQYQNYLVRALLDYKSGERKNGMMNGQAAGLSKQDIEELATYFSQQKSPLHTKK